jgi:hypothetical protein
MTEKHRSSKAAVGWQRNQECFIPKFEKEGQSPPRAVEPMMVMMMIIIIISQKAHYISAIMINQLLQVRDIVAVYCQNYTKRLERFRVLETRYMYKKRPGSDRLSS